MKLTVAKQWKQNNNSHHLHFIYFLHFWLIDLRTNNPIRKNNELTKIGGTN